MNGKHLFVFFCFFFCLTASAQEDSSLLFKNKKGIWNKIGRAVMRREPVSDERGMDDFEEFRGLRIRDITIEAIGFDQPGMKDAKGLNLFAKRIAAGIHKDTRESTIRKNLMFREGSMISPLLLADNERFLRDLPFLQDALIAVKRSITDAGEEVADVTVYTRDVFSLGGSVDISSQKKGRLYMKEENINGYGHHIGAGILYDRARKPMTALSGDAGFRNISSSFLNVFAGYSDFVQGYLTGLRSERNLFLSVEKPLVSRFTLFTGGFNFNYRKNFPAYEVDSIHDSIHQYTEYESDIWAGYNIGARSGRNTLDFKNLRHFIAVRTLWNKFSQRPFDFGPMDYNFVNTKAMLISYSVFRQNFFKTNYLYGFGRYEDVPFGLKGTLTTGFANRAGIKTPYYGLNFEGARFSKNKFYTDYILMAGGFLKKGAWLDANLLLGLKHFTRLRSIGHSWHQRIFAEAYYSSQFNSAVTMPLLLSSIYGIGYFRNGEIAASRRASGKLEAVFYNPKPILGLRFAPFAFGDGAYLNDLNQDGKWKFYSAVGAGMRARNENLMFGTVEARAAYIPTPVAGMKNFRFTFSTNLRFRYNNTFISKPDFINPN